MFQSQRQSNLCFTLRTYIDIISGKNMISSMSSTSSSELVLQVEIIFINFQQITCFFSKNILSLKEENTPLSLCQGSQWSGFKHIDSIAVQVCGQILYCLPYQLATFSFYFCRSCLYILHIFLELTITAKICQLSRPNMFNAKCLMPIFIN